MKKTVIILFLPLLLSCNKGAYLFTSFREPAQEGLRLLYSYDGYEWKDFGHIFLKPAVGNQKVMRDPSMVKGPDGTFHLVWTSSWRGDKGFGYASSRDLLNWSDQRIIPVMQQEPTSVNVWAPELFYDEEAGEYIIIWASCIPGRYERGIEEDSNNHRMYVTTTKDFQTFTPTVLFFDPQFSVIDAVIVKRNQNDFVLVVKDNTRPERNIKVAFASRPLGPYVNVSRPFSDNFTEGPTVIKLDKDWVIYYDSYQEKIYEAAATTDFIQFRDVTSRTRLPEGHKHGTIVPVKKRFVKKLRKNLGKEP